MLRTVVPLALVVIVAALVIPSLRVTVTWILAFLSLLMAADLLRSSLRRKGGSERDR